MDLLIQVYKPMVEHGYCFHCRKKVALKSTTWVLDSRGSVMLRGVCAICNGKVAARVKSEDIPEDMKKKSAAYKKAHPAKSKSKSKSKSKAGGRSRSTPRKSTSRTRLIQYA